MYFIIKDLKRILYDKKSLLMLILMPIVLQTILGFSLKGSFASDTGIKEPIKIAVVKEYDKNFEIDKFKNMMSSLGDMYENNISDLDELILSNDPETLFFDKFLEQEEVKKYVKYTVVDMVEAEKLLKKLDVYGIVILPKNYVYNTYVNMVTPFNNKVTIDVIKNTEARINGSIVEGMINSYNEMFNSIIAAKNVFIDVNSTYVKNDNVYADIEKLFEGITDTKVDIKEKAIEGKDVIDSFTYNSIGILSMFILYSASMCGRFLLIDKNNFTLQRQMGLGVSMKRLYISNFLCTIFFALIQCLIMIIYSAIVLKVNWVNIPLTLITTFILTLPVAGISVLISVLSLKLNSFKAANIFENGILFFMAAVGGTFFPIYIMPEAMQKLSNLSVTGIGIKMYLKIILGDNIQSLFSLYSGLLLFTAVLLICAGLLDRTRREAV